MHIWIEHRSEIKLTLRLTGEEAGDLRQALVAANQHLALSVDQHRLINNLALALEVECPTHT
jgi:hypothetical protein